MDHPLINSGLRVTGVECATCHADVGPFGRRDGKLICEACLLGIGEPPVLSDLDRAREIAARLEEENFILRRCLANLLGIDGEIDVELIVSMADVRVVA